MDITCFVLSTQSIEFREEGFVGERSVGRRSGAEDAPAAQAYVSFQTFVGSGAGSLNVWCTHQSCKHSWPGITGQS